MDKLLLRNNNKSMENKHINFFPSFNFDNEENIIRLMYDDLSERLLVHNNSFEQEVFECLNDIDNLKFNNGHNCLPPDCYSNKHNLMFDVMRINDSEVSKHKNPIKERERKIINELKQRYGIDEKNIIVDSQLPGKGYDKEHKIDYYLKQYKRVVENHINKIPTWEKEHPSITRKGLLICDETELFFEGKAIKLPLIDKWMFLSRKNGVIHKPWADKKMMEIIFNSKLDFVIWYFPYKPYSAIKKSVEKYPSVVIVDTRKHENNLIEYDYSVLTIA